MAFLQYNGVTIDISKTLLFESRNVYTRDNTQYLYTHFHIRVQGMINPGLPTTPGRPKTGPLPTANLPVPPGTSLPVISPAVTVNQLRNLLKQPRMPLLFSMLDMNDATKTVGMIRSPRQRPGFPGVFFDRDSKNGPNPIGTPDIVEINGDKSFIVVFEIETWINECDNVHGSSNFGRIILAHRWTDNQSIDQDFYTTRTITGTAIFDASWLSLIGLAPDDFRSTFFHPVQNGFQRRNIEVQATEDGLACNYSVTDEQTPYTLNRNFNITRFQGIFRIGVSMPGGLISLGIQEAANALRGTPFAPVANFVRNLLPKRTAQLQLTVFGNPSTTRLQLITAMRRVASNYGLLSGGAFQPATVLASVNAFAEINLAERIGSFTQTVALSSLENALAGTGIDSLRGANQVLDIPSDVNAPNPNSLTFFNTKLFEDGIGGFASPLSERAPSPPGDSGARGVAHRPGDDQSVLERCVAQALASTCADPVEAKTLATLVGPDPIGIRSASFEYSGIGGAP